MRLTFKVKKGSFVTAVNKLNYVFKNVDSFTKTKLLQTYCTSWYGCQSWQLGTPDANILDVEWRKAVRRTLGLPARTRSILLPGLAGNKPFCQQHHSRVVNFVNTLIKCKNESVNYIVMRAQRSTVGPLGKNIALLKTCPPVDQGDPTGPLDSRIAQIRELIRLRDGSDRLDVLNMEEIQEMLVYNCTR